MLYSKNICISLLTEKQKEINSCGVTRFPKKSDLTDEQVQAIKAYLGPWPRALEKAGLKEERKKKI